MHHLTLFLGLFFRLTPNFVFVVYDSSQAYDCVFLEQVGLATKIAMTGLIFLRVEAGEEVLSKHGFLCFLLLPFVYHVS